MISLALLGKNISHSRSPEIYRKLCKQEINYKIIDCESESDIPSLDEIFKHYQGLSVTSPYKKFFLKQVTVLPDFLNLNAINAIRKSETEFEAINTDFLAIEEIIKKLKFSNIIILGDGVMSFVTQKVLEKKGLDFKVISRREYGPIEKIDLTKEFLSSNKKNLIINSCARNFIFRGSLPDNSIFWDFNYDFKPHKKYIPTKNIVYIDGLELLQLQAKIALKFFRF